MDEPVSRYDWLADHRDTVSHRWVEEGLISGAAFMSSQGFVHFDAHFNNVLTDGDLLYFADFGLALSNGFDLASTVTCSPRAKEHCSRPSRSRKPSRLWRYRHRHERAFLATAT